MVNLIWATRGRSWGFRFLLDGGSADPLHAYERAFAGLENELVACHRRGSQVALRLPDPNSRMDAARRIIPHDFVVPLPIANRIYTVDDGLTEIWPLISHAYAQVWDRERPPSVAEIRAVLAAGGQV